MTVFEFIDLSTDSFKVRIYDMAKEEEVYKGWSDETPDEYEDYDVWSYDPPCMECADIILNIETEED